jgi:hypothetical protein
MIILLLSSGIYCQQMWDQPLLIRDSENYYRNTKSIVTDDNCIIHVWSEVREGIADIFAMKFDNEGNSLWGEESTLINTSSISKIYPQIIETNDGGSVIAWREIDSTSYNIRAQKINSAGQALWGESGVLVTDDFNDDSSFTLLSNNLGGAIISWFAPCRIAVNLNNAGIDQWDSLALGEDPYDYQIVSDGENGLLQFKKEYSEDDIASLVFKKINLAGAEEWTQSMLLAEDNYNFAVVNNNNGDYYIIENFYSLDYSALNIKKLLANGTFYPTENTINILLQICIIQEGTATLPTIMGIYLYP